MKKSLLALFVLVSISVNCQSLNNLLQSESKKIIETFSGQKLDFSRLYVNNFPCTSCGVASLIFSTSKLEASLNYKGVSNLGELSNATYKLDSNQQLKIEYSWHSISKLGIQDATIQIDIDLNNSKNNRWNYTVTFFNSSIEMTSFGILNATQLNLIKSNIENSFSFQIIKKNTDSINNVIKLENEAIELDKINNDRKVEMVISASGIDYYEASAVAIENSLKQALLVFTNIQTKKIVDSLVQSLSDSTKENNIYKASLLGNYRFPNGQHLVVIKARISIEKLLNQLRAEGYNVSFPVSSLVFKIKQQLINEQAELTSVLDIFGNVHESLQNSLTFNVRTKEPVSIDNKDSKIFGIHVTVSSVSNDNYDTTIDLFLKSIKHFSLSTSEIKSYDDLKKSNYLFKISYNGIYSNIYLRSSNSVNIIASIMANWRFYNCNFNLENGLHQTRFNLKGNFHLNEIFKDIYAENYKVLSPIHVLSIDFPRKGSVLSELDWDDFYTLEEIDKINDYKISQSGIISNFRFGGYFLGLINNERLFMSPIDFGPYKNSIEANSKSNEWNLGIYDDWKLADINQLKAIAQTNSPSVGGFKSVRSYVYNNKLNGDEKNSAYSSYMPLHKEGEKLFLFSTAIDDWISIGNFSLNQRYSILNFKGRFTQFETDNLYLGKDNYGIDLGNWQIGNKYELRVGYACRPIRIN